ncbi:MAG: DCC1-like thiol-disulfide oxidoreductase family protein [Bryobacteraceae bacterium]
MSWVRANLTTADGSGHSAKPLEKAPAARPRPPAPRNQADVVFYDGHCGLCHWAVKFVLKHDLPGKAFRFAPLQGETFQARVPFERRGGVPDSIAIETCDGALLVRSDACVHVLRRLGGGWSVIAALVAGIPRPLRDAFYNFMARIRYRAFGRRGDPCPIVPPELRERFDP